MQLTTRRSLYRLLADRRPLPVRAPGQQSLGHGFSVLLQFSIRPAVRVE
jgi:hypothetical protein